MSRRIEVLPSLRRRAGFTLIELLIVMVILGLLAALVGPKLFGHVDQAKVDSTRTQISSLQTALDAFRLDVGRYPTTEEGLAVLRTQPADDAPGATRWRGPYLPRMPKDGWGNDFHYTAPGQHGDYDLLSYGADNKEGGDGNDADVTSWDASETPKDAAKP
jgi:general secretion pathway protein G